MNVSHTVDSEFIKKLSKVVEANLANENFGVRELAKKTRISRTQLHSKIKTITHKKSIAVLPFKNYSEDEQNQYFADGLAEDLLSRLATINELKVISRNII